MHLSKLNIEADLLCLPGLGEAQVRRSTELQSLNQIQWC